jgi:hypothetical protein
MDLANALTSDGKTLQSHDDVTAERANNNPELSKGSEIFKNDSTANLMKKFVVYKLMGSDIFINHSLGMMKMSYKCLGTRFTNYAINNTVASIFTSGESIDSLLKDVENHETRNISHISGFVVEGVKDYNEAVMAKYYSYIKESIIAQA